MNLPYYGIALEGGGVAGTAYAGVIEVLEEMGLYAQLTHFAGSSAGSMVAGLMACRVIPSKIKEILLKLDYTELEDNSWFIFKDVYRLYDEYGWNKGDALERVYGDILEEYVGNRNITYAEVKSKYNATLITTATDVVKAETVYYTPENTPDMPIVKGIRESASIPLFYCPIEKDQTLLVDGGVLNNYPIRKLYEYLEPSQVFGAKLVSNTKPKRKAQRKPEHLLEYIRVLIDMLHDQNLKVHVHKEDWQRTISIDIGEVSATDFKLNTQEKIKLIEQGQAATRSFFS